MPFINKLFYFTLTSFLAFACASPTATITKQKPEQGPVEKREEVIWKKPEKEPEWVQKPPQNDEDHLYFVGFSNKFAEEKAARNNALIDATNQFVRFCGVDVQLIDEYFESVDQSSSETIDPQIRSESREFRRAEAFVRRVKAREYFTVQFAYYQKTIQVENAYQVKVLVQVPQSDFGKIGLQRLVKRRNFFFTGGASDKEKADHKRGFSFVAVE